MKRKRHHAELEQRIGYRFKDPHLLELALTHPSYRNECASYSGDNQRMEFLGDAVLSLVCANALYRARENATEGELTKARAIATCTSTLADLSRTLGIGDILKLGKGEQKAGGQTRAKALADALEALLGAIFLDGGFENVAAVITRFPRIVYDSENESAFLTNPKGYLQELLQKDHRIPTYRIRETSGPAHARHFTVDLVVSGEVVAMGEGPSRRMAEHNAAAAALRIVTNKRRRISADVGE